MGPEVVLSRKRFLLIRWVLVRCSVGRIHTGLRLEPAVGLLQRELCWGWWWHPQR